MRIYLSFIVVLCLSGFAHSAHAQTSTLIGSGDTHFFESLYDVPKMQGLSEIKDMSISFDKAEGRIAYATALLEKASKEQVLKFYRQSLPQLGWKAAGINSYTRESEKLKISFEEYTVKSKTSTLVKFSLSPIAQ